MTETARRAGYRKSFGSWRPRRGAGAQDARQRSAALQALADATSRDPDDVLAILTVAAARDRDEKVRATAVSALGQAVGALRRRAGRGEGPGERAAGAEAVLARALVDGSDEVRLAAVRALGPAEPGPGAEVWTQLPVLLEDTNPDVRLAAALVLADRPETSTSDAVASLARSAVPEGVVALGRADPEVLVPIALESPATYGAALDLLTGVEGAERLRTSLIRALGDRRLAGLGAELARRVAQRSDRSLRELVQALAATGAPEGVPVLLDLVADRSLARDVRVEALHGLEAHGEDVPVASLDGLGAAAAEHVRTHLGRRADATSRVLQVAARRRAETGARLAALDVLATRRAPATVDALLGVALDDQADWDVRVRSVEVLAESGDRRIAGPLERVLVAETAAAQPELVEVADTHHSGVEAFNDPWSENPQHDVGWRPSRAARLGVAVTRALAPIVDEHHSERVQLALWLVEQQADSICAWVRRADAPADQADRSAAMQFLLSRLDWLDVDQALQVAVALSEAGFEPARAFVGSVAALAREMAAMPDVDTEEWFMGDQTAEVRSVRVSREPTRARGRARLEQLAAT